MIAVSWAWGDPIPDVSERHALEITVTTPTNQAMLHRELAGQGYAIELVEGDNVWHAWHPDGERP